MEKLNAHINLKERIVGIRKRKFEALHRLYLQGKLKGKEGNTEEELNNFLEKRKEVLKEISTRAYERERRLSEKASSPGYQKVTFL